MALQFELNVFLKEFLVKLEAFFDDEEILEERRPRRKTLR